MRVILAGITVLALAGAAAISSAQPAPEHRERRADPQAVQQRLGLSEEQTAQLRKTWTEGRKQAIRRRAEIRIARMELAEALDQRTVDEKAVAAKVKALADLQTVALQARTDERLAVRRILTPEQYEKMKQLRRDRRWARGREGARGWRERRPGPGRGAATQPGASRDPGGAEEDAVAGGL